MVRVRVIPVRFYYFWSRTNNESVMGKVKSYSALDRGSSVRILRNVMRVVNTLDLISSQKYSFLVASVSVKIFI